MAADLSVRRGPVSRSSRTGPGYPRWLLLLAVVVTVMVLLPVVFLLWGSYAQKKEALIDTDRHVVLKAAHPSPLSAKKFRGSRPFSAN